MSLSKVVKSKQCYLHLKTNTNAYIMSKFIYLNKSIQYTGGKPRNYHEIVLT